MAKVLAHSYDHLKFSPFTLYLLQIAVFGEYMADGCQCTTTNADVVCSMAICFVLERHLQLGQKFART